MVFEFERASLVPPVAFVAGGIVFVFINSCAVRKATKRKLLVPVQLLAARF